VQLFVSYARADIAVADALVSDAQSLGHRAFYDRELVGGQRWWDALLDQIEAAAVFVPVLSDDYRGSEACRAEAVWAMACGVPFLPVSTGQQVPGLYDPVIAEANWVAFDPQSRESLAALARGLASMPPASPPVVTPARPPVPVSYMNLIEQQIRGVGEIPRGDQLALVYDLRAKLGSRDEEIARTLLSSLRSRPDLTVEAATVIDELLGVNGADAADRSADRGPTHDPAPPGRLPRLTRPTTGWLVGMSTLMWLIAVTVLPWAPYRNFEDYPIHRPRLWQTPNVVPPVAVMVAIVTAVVVTGLAALAIVVVVPRAVRIAVAAGGVFVAVVAVVGTVISDLAVAPGSGVWVYVAAMLTLGVALVLTPS